MNPIQQLPQTFSLDTLRIASTTVPTQIEQADIEQLITIKEWSVLKILLESISCESSIPSWWTNTISETVETSLISHHNPLYIIESESLALYAKLKWKKGVKALADRTFMYPDEMLIVRNNLGTQFFQDLYRTMPLTVTIDSVTIYSQIKEFYLIDATAASIFINRLIAVTGTSASPLWWNDATNRYNACLCSVNNRDRDTALAFAALSIQSPSRMNAANIANSISKAALQGWGDVCKRFVESGASLFTCDCFGDPTWKNILKAFPTQVTDIISPKKLTEFLATLTKNEDLYAWEYVEKQLGTNALKSLISLCSFENEETAIPLIKSIILKGHAQVLEPLLNTMFIADKCIILKALFCFFQTNNTQALAVFFKRLEKEQPNWWKDPKQLSQVYCYAIKYDRLDIAQELFAHIDIEQPCGLLEDKTPLMIAAEKGKKEAIIALIGRGASIRPTNSLGFSQRPVLELILNSHCVTAKELIEHMPYNGPHTLTDMAQIASYETSTVINTLKGWVNAGHFPHIRSILNIEFLYAMCGNDLGNSVLSALPLVEATSFTWLNMLCDQSQIGAAVLGKRLLATLGTVQQPTWWNSARAAHLYCTLVLPSGENEEAHRAFQDKRVELIEALLPHMKIQEMSPPDRKNIFNTACTQATPSLLIGLIRIGLPVSVAQFEMILRKHGERALTHIFQYLTLHDVQTFSLLLILIKSQHTTASAFAQTLFERIITAVAASQRPSWFNETRATELFFTLMRQNPNAFKTSAEKLVAYVSGTKSDLQNKNRTPLMIALENAFAASAIVSLLTKSSLFHIDTDGKSAFKLLVEKNSFFTSDQSVQAVSNKLKECLKTCGLPEEDVSKMLRKFAEAAHNTSAPLSIRIFSHLLNNNKNDLKELLEPISLQNRIALILPIIGTVGELLQNLYIDIAFDLDPSHFEYSFTSETIPSKENSSMKIDQVLLKLYDDYAQTKSDARRAALGTFISRVTNCTPYIGTPLANSTALITFYQIIDNATCTTIKKLTTDMKKLTAEREQLEHTNTSTDAIRNKINEQLNRINLFLDAYIEAGPVCGGAYMSNATQQYAQVVLGKSSDLKSNIQTLAGSLRQHILERLVSNATRINEETGLKVAEDQTTHLYDLFLREKGKKYGIPGHTMVDFDDMCVYPRHRDQVVEIDTAFPKHYTPSLILDFMQKSFEEDPQHGQLVTKLQSDKHADWCKIFVPFVISEIHERFSTFPTTSQTQVVTATTTINSTTSTAPISNTASSSQPSQQQKVMATAPTLTKTQQDIADFLATTYFITLENELTDLTSLETLDQALRTHPQFYLAYNREGKTFKKEAVLEALVDFQILSPSQGKSIQSQVT